MEWQPIDTAPKDKRILVWSGQEIYAAHWAQHMTTDDEAWIVAQWGDEGDQALVKPTHWMPLPEAPNVQIEGLRRSCAVPLECRVRTDRRIGRIVFGICKYGDMGSNMQEFNTLKIDAECVTGEYTSMPSGECRHFSYRLDEIKNLTIQLFSDRQSDKKPHDLQTTNSEAR